MRKHWNNFEYRLKIAICCVFLITNKKKKEKKVKKRKVSRKVCKRVSIQWSGVLPLKTSTVIRSKSLSMDFHSIFEGASLSSAFNSDFSHFFSEIKWFLRFLLLFWFVVNNLFSLISYFQLFHFPTNAILQFCNFAIVGCYLKLVAWLVGGT